MTGGAGVTAIVVVWRSMVCDSVLAGVGSIATVLVEFLRAQQNIPTARNTTKHTPKIGARIGLKSFPSR